MRGRGDLRAEWRAVIEPGAEVYIQFAENDASAPGHAPGEERCLHPGTILEGSGTSFLGEFRIKDRAFAPGTEAILYQEFRGRFLQSWVSIQAMETRARAWRLWLDVVSAPHSAESRQWQRVSAVGTSVRVTLEGKFPAELIDLGVNGFSVATSEAYAVGDVVPADLFYKGRSYRSDIVIKSSVPMPEGTVHYGALCIDEDGAPNAQGFPDIYLALLRESKQRDR